jgi:hypothetical protein
VCISRDRGAWLRAAHRQHSNGDSKLQSFALSRNWRYRDRVKIDAVYTDPGSGLFLIQIASAVVLTVSYRFRRAIAALFGRKKPADSD